MTLQATPDVAHRDHDNRLEGIMTVEEIRKHATVNVETAAAFMGIGKGTAYEAIRRGELKGLKLGRRIVVPVTPLLAMVGAEAEASA